MSTSRTTTTTQTTASTSSRPADPPSPGAPIDENENEIIREALARVERVKAQKAAEEAEKKKRVAARRQAAQDARDRAIWAREQEDEIIEWRRKLAEAATARSQGGNSTGDVSASPSLLYKLRDLDLSNVEATPHVEPCITSPLLPSTLEDIHPQAQSPGTYPPGRIPSRELTTSRLNSIYDLFDSYIDILAGTTPTTRYYKVPSFYLTSLRLRDLSGPSRNPLKGHHLFAPATTRSFLSSVAVPVAPFELQPAPSTLQHKPSYTKPYPKTYSDPGLTLYQALPSPNGLVATKCLRCQRNNLLVPKSNQRNKRAASSTVITVAAGQRLMSIPEQSFGDETASNVRTPEGRQPAVQEPPPVEPGMGPPPRRYTSMGYAQPASSPMGGSA
ncbi:hypothetical protein F5051DRAFT_446836 [Lentinula edodes]|nr:hypothetical protein F5051DRAFT_446836 [Lentinula edodes]